MINKIGTPIPKINPKIKSFSYLFMIITPSPWSVNENSVKCVVTMLYKSEFHSKSYLDHYFICSS